MKNFVAFSIMLILSQKSISQTYEELGVRFILKDSLITFDNIDKKFKIIKIVEKDFFENGEIQLLSKYQVEGDVIENHKFCTKKGVVEIEIIYGKKNKKIVLERDSLEFIEK